MAIDKRNMAEGKLFTEMDTNLHTSQAACHDAQIPAKGKSDGVQISIGQVGNIIVGNNSKMVISSKSTKKSKQKEKEIPCQYALTTSHEALTNDQKLDIKDKIGSHWKDLGRRLGISDSELEQLEMENSNNYSEVTYQIMSRWEQRVAHKATCGALALVFQKMRRGDLADLLSQSVKP